MFRKSALVLTAIIALTGVLAACSKGNGGEGAAPGNSQPATETASAPAAESPVSSTGKFDPPVKITTARPVASDVVYKEGEDTKNNVHIQWAKDKLGINIDYIWTVGTYDAYHNKIKLALASNEPLPDVFIVEDAQLAKQVIESGRAMDISEAYDMYASERMKQMYADNPTAWQSVSKDGRKFGIPILQTGAGEDPILWIRQDWLDKLSLQAPTTIEELEAVMDAFVNQDPDGNNKKDTAGIALTLRDGFNSWVDGKFVFGAYSKDGVLPKYWHENAEGQLEYGSIHPDMKQGLAKFHEWYTKGYLFEDAGAADLFAAFEKFNQGKVGIIAGPYWMGDWPLPDVFKNVPESVIKPYPLPRGPEGVHAPGERLVKSRMFFNKDFKHMDAFFKYYDETLGYWYNDENSDFKYGFAEGYDYVLENGEAVYDPEKLPNGYINAGKYMLSWNPPNVPFVELNVYKDLATGKPAETYLEKKLAGLPPLKVEGGAVLANDLDKSVHDRFVGAPTKTMESKGVMLNKLENETFVKIVYGRLPLDDFDKFVANWKASGGDQITEEVNEWYQSVK
ncbi:hypothetical protein B1A99_12315 [Cohnella sp. CIP 111063]|uniref:extracellular solute-binding protein n=1 Tax=unclassified Cohnella TaxID=2636738 RepID=UPI000B8BE635|nr:MULTISPECIES: extracellular solute-binding protein [unclassified Cohnella]OXS58754.1 hypothetical protein B1A99_12315 [Cohnella sp. CIP 111063]PRX71830.1 aldotetraouronic acid ABC transporter substrate-binding protein /aldotetraouronic acid ABC transporter substrate-binding protein [Cohnella sp. SGD-V74]